MNPQPTEEIIAQRRALLETEWHFEIGVEKFIRDTIEPVTCYICPFCDKKHHDEYEAENCCPRDIEQDRAYPCPTCEELHDSAAEAYLCCDDNQTAIPLDEGLRYQANHIQLEQRGQTRLFN